MQYINRQWLRDLLGVHKKTVDRWHQKQSFPKAVRLLHQILVRGDMGAICPNWSGWTLKDEELVSPENEVLPLHQVRALKFTYAQLDFSYHKINEQRETINEQDTEIERLKAIIADPVAAEIAGLEHKLSTLRAGQSAQIHELGQKSA